MQTTPTIESTVLPVPIHHNAAPTDQRLTATPTANDTTGSPPSPGRRNPTRITLAKLRSVIRGDKYMANAYPPAWHDATDARNSGVAVRQDHDGESRAAVRSAVAPMPSTAEPAGPAPMQTKER